MRHTVRIGTNEPPNDAYALLQQTRATLSDPDNETLYLLEELLAQNDFELAFDALTDVAVHQQSRLRVWRALADIAATVCLTADNPLCGNAVRTILTYLEAAPPWMGLRSLLNQWDPIGVKPNAGGPEDEYDCMIAPLMGMLRIGDSEQRISAFLHAHLTDHMGLDPCRGESEEFAARARAWWSTERST